MNNRGLINTGDINQKITDNQLKQKKEPQQLQ